MNIPIDPCLVAPRSRSLPRIYQSKSEANKVLRSVRANTGVFEETLDGSIERECYEETCMREELNEAAVDEDEAAGLETRPEIGLKFDLMIFS